MRVLVVGAGAIGGYFGGRLLKAGRDVTFLVRPKRAAALAETGLVIRSPKGDVDIARPPTVTSDRLDSTFDLVLLSCKAFDLEDAIASFAPAVGPETVILPLLNGMSHLDALDRRFGAEHVLGGQCVISSALDAEGRILHLNEAHALTFGARDGSGSARIEAVAAALANAGFDTRLSETILSAMWEKWIFISSIAGVTCLMRASIGDVVAAGGADLATALLAECAAIAAGQGFPPSASALERGRATVTAAGSSFTASMLRDIEQGARIEADHIIGDLLRRGQESAGPLLRTVYIHLKAYEARRAREL
ncbi:MAG TPA: 2-dehydropantoate 2-reductase [Aliidongia sp.]|nr:2-dehydropantoate 2-reductase [Aliidongia sp.]